MCLLQAHKSLAHAPLDNIRQELAQLSMERKAAQLGQSRRYARASSHSMLHAPTGSINLERASSVATGAAAGTTEQQLAGDEPSRQHAVGQHTASKQSEFSVKIVDSRPVDAVVRITARRSSQLYDSLNTQLTRRSTIANSSSELPAPITDFHKPFEGVSRWAPRHQTDRKHEPKHSARRAGMQPFWEYLFISAIRFIQLHVYATDFVAPAHALLGWEGGSVVQCGSST